MLLPVLLRTKLNQPTVSPRDEHKLRQHVRDQEPEQDGVHAAAPTVLEAPRTAGKRTELVGLGSCTAHGQVCVGPCQEPKKSPALP